LIEGLGDLMAKIPKANDRLPRWIDENLPTELATSSLFRFNVKLQAMVKDEETGKLKRQEITVDILPDLDLDAEIVDQQMSDLPAQYAFWAAVYSEVRLGVAVAERKLKARKGEVTKLVKQEAAKEGVKLTEKEVVIIVEADARLNEAEMSFQHAQMQSGKLYHMVEALKLKAELSRSLLGLKKRERDNS
jgi:hypothetical protein